MHTYKYKIETTVDFKDDKQKWENYLNSKSYEPGWRWISYERIERRPGRCYLLHTWENLIEVSNL